MRFVTCKQWGKNKRENQKHAHHRTSWRSTTALQPQSQQINGIFAQHLALVLLGNFRAPRHRPGYLSRLRGVPTWRLGGGHETVTAQVLNGPFKQAVFERFAADVNALIENI